MRLVEQSVIKRSDPYFHDMKDMCHKSKNLYNSALFEIRQFYFENKKYLPYAKLDKIFKDQNNVDYRSLPAQTAQQTMRCVDHSFKSFFNSLKLSGKHRIPHYLDKDGYFMVIFTSQQISHKWLKHGIIKVGNICFKTRQSNVKQVRFLPRQNHIIMEVVYEIDDVKMKPDNKNYAAIDLGVSNLATVTSNVIPSFIINGRSVKSINQYYNKKKAVLQSKLTNSKTSKRIDRLGQKRHNKITDYFHKSSSYIVNQLDSNHINTLIIGKNNGWKQDIKLGTENNQKITSIPFNQFIQMLQYKCQLRGINVIIREESYTSKSSFLDRDLIPNLKDVNIPNFSGTRIHRGLYRSKKGILNADVNGSLNILRKEVGDVIYNQPIEGLVFNPIRISIL